jgi:hypothetical protein
MKRESLYHLLKQSMIILCLLSSAAAEGVECRYLSKLTKENPQPELSAQGTCGEFAGQDEFRMYPEYLSKVFFKNGLAEILVDDKAFYIAESDKGVRVYLFDNGADYFSEGVARAISGGKVGYVDIHLTMVIKPEFDFAFPLANGRAIVCMGCDPVAEAEHHTVIGGKWGVIDKSGATVIPIRYTREDLTKIREQNNEKEGR